MSKVGDQLARWRKDFDDAFDEVEAQADAERKRRRIDWGVIGVIVLASVCLSVQEYYGGSTNYTWLEGPLGWFYENPKKVLRSMFRSGERARLHRLYYWVLATTACYMILPVLYTKLALRERLRDYGFSLKGTLKHSWIYVGMYLLVLPALFVVGSTEGFQRTYPFYKGASKSLMDFVLWEAAYALQFVSLEFFFRGFLIHGLKRRFGVYCVLISVIPYCMIHFGKPLPETLGAIVAGIALGLLSLFTRSIWLGAAIHVSVAVSMDVIAMWYSGKLVF